MQTYIFKEDFRVRDYECDIQGVVNNANYLHYMEHTRHQFLLKLGENFARLHEDHIDFYVRKVSVEYFHPLKSGDSFVCCLNCHKKGARGMFVQDIYLEDHTLVTKGTIEVVEVVNGILTRGTELDRIISLIQTSCPVFQISLPISKMS